MSLNVSVENLGPCKKLLRIEVPVDRVNSTFEEITGAFQREAQLPGFRPGKVPRHLVARNFESRIADETRRKLADESFKQAAAQEKLRVIVTLGTEELSFGRGLPFSYTVTLEHAPEFSLPGYKGLHARRELTAVTDADVDRAINNLREQRAKYNDVHRAAQKGDVAVINYVGRCEGRSIKEFNPTAIGLTEKQNFWVLLADGSFIPGFTDQLIGASAGDKKTVTVTFPAEFVIKEVAGKTGEYDVEVVGIKEKELPAVNDEFAKAFGEQDVDGLNLGVRRALQTELEGRAKRAVRDQLLKQLLDVVQFDLPDSVVTSETRQLVYNVVNENQQRGVPQDQIESKKDEIYASAHSSARERVKAGFILNRIAETENIRVDQRELSQRVIALAEENNVTPEKMVKAIQERNAFPGIQQELLTLKVLDFLELHAALEDVAPATPSVPAATEAPAAS
jgi:trigger factor